MHNTQKFDLQTFSFLLDTQLDSNIYYLGPLDTMCGFSRFGIILQPRLVLTLVIKMMRKPKKFDAKTWKHA